MHGNNHKGVAIPKGARLPLSNTGRGECLMARLLLVHYRGPQRHHMRRGPSFNPKEGIDEYQGWPCINAEDPWDP